MSLQGRLPALVAIGVAIAATTCNAQSSTWSTEQPAQTAISSQLDEALFSQEQQAGNGPGFREPGLISQPTGPGLMRNASPYGEPTPADPPQDLSKVPFDNFQFVPGSEQNSNADAGNVAEQSPAATNTPTPGPQGAVNGSNLTVGQGGYTIIDKSPQSSATCDDGCCMMGGCGPSCCDAPIIISSCRSGCGFRQRMDGMCDGISDFFRNYGMGNCGSRRCPSPCDGASGGIGRIFGGGLSSIFGGGCGQGCGCGGCGQGSCGLGGCGLGSRPSGSLIGNNPWSCCSGGLGNIGGRIYGGADYLHWWTRGQRIPTLVTTSPAGTPIDRAGVLNWPNTTALLGPGRLSSDDHSGSRFTLGYNFDDCGTRGLVGDYFVLNESTNRFYARAPEDYAILARPYFNTLAGDDDAELIGYPGIVNGTVITRTSTDFQGGGIMFRQSLLSGSCCDPCGSCCDPCGEPCCGGGNWLSGMFGRVGGWMNGPCSAICGRLPSCSALGLTPTRVDALIGYRAYDLDESLFVREYLTTTDPAGAFPVGTNLDRLDTFVTENKFHGVAVGTDNEWMSCGRWGVGSRLRLSFGELQRRAFIGGQTTISSPGVAPVSHNAGLLASTSNNGSYRDDKFVVIPEVGLNMFYKLRPNTRLNFGYTMIYMDDVWRPGDTIDTSVNPNLIPPPTAANADRPRFAPQEDDFWAQGINAGIELRY